MFYTFESQHLKIPKRQGGKIIVLIPIQDNCIVALDDQNCLTKYKIPSGIVKGFIKLPFQARKIIALSSGNLAVLAPTQRTLYEIQISNDKKINIHTFHVEQSHYNTQYLMQKEKQYFTTMQVAAFNQAQACFIKQERTDQRRIKLHFFTKQSNPQTKLTQKEKSKEWTCFSHQQNMSGCFIDKFQEKSKVVFWKQQIAQNGQLEFDILDYKTRLKTPLHLQSPNFTSFTIVRAIKSTKQGIIICLNHKNPVILLFDNNSINENWSKLIKTNLIRIVNLESCILNFCFSQEQKSSGRLEIRNPTGDLMGNVQALFDQIIPSKSGELIISFSRQVKDNGYITFQAIRVIRKQTLYLNLLEQTNKNRLSTSYMDEILSLL